MSFTFSAQGRIESIIAHLRHVLAHLEGRDGDASVNVTASGAIAEPPEQASITVAPVLPAEDALTAAPPAQENPSAQENAPES